ncbi:hypothetical protein ACJX0J_013322, partial [Zea mays]
FVAFLFFSFVLHVFPTSCILYRVLLIIKAWLSGADKLIVWAIGHVFTRVMASISLLAHVAALYSLCWDSSCLYKILTTFNTSIDLEVYKYRQLDLCISDEHPQHCFQSECMQEHKSTHTTSIVEKYHLLMESVNQYMLNAKKRTEIHHICHT